jgi:hypothetical protein
MIRKRGVALAIHQFVIFKRKWCCHPGGSRDLVLHEHPFFLRKILAFAGMTTH